MAKRAFLIVLDSFGIGYEPDADLFGDVGANTLASVAKSPKFNVPAMQSLGLFNIEGVEVGVRANNPVGCYARLREKSMGKDTTIGHWEMAGIISPKPMPTFPEGFPAELIDEFEKNVGRGVLCNKPYSGTEVIRDYGEEHMKTGKLIVYTSADSVFQIAAHEEIVPLEELYDICKKARAILKGPYAVGRVIARPFVGTNRNDFKRTPNRHDFSLLPPHDTMLDLLQKEGYDTIGVGKIYDIFAGKGISDSIVSKSNKEGMDAAIRLLERDFAGLAFINLVEFDMTYGHRRDIDGYANALSEFDAQLTQFLSKMKEDDILIITADHGCDPGFEKTTDHTREYVPMLAYGKKLKESIDLKTRSSFSDIAATVLDYFSVEQTIAGESYLADILK